MEILLEKAAWEVDSLQLNCNELNLVTPQDDYEKEGKTD